MMTKLAENHKQNVLTLKYSVNTNTQIGFYPETNYRNQASLEYTLNRLLSGYKSKQT